MAQPTTSELAEISLLQEFTGEDVAGPAAKERMRDKKADAEGSKHDESAAFGLHEDLTSVSSKDENKQ